MTISIRIEYEWVVEELSEDLEDIIDVNHFPSYDTALAHSVRLAEDRCCNLGLLRHEVEHDGCGHEDEVGRAYWYLTADGRFDDGRTVPQRFRKECGL